MSSILCDTNIIIEGLKGNPTIATVLQKMGTANLAISVVTVAELYYGALNKVELRQLQKHLSPLHQVPLTPDISYKSLELMEAYALSHRPALPDVLIAATALVQDMELYTLNLKDFRYIPGLKLYRP